MSELSAWAPTIVSFVVMVFTAGILVQRVKDHDRRIADHDDLLDDHGKRLDRHSNAIARAEGWRAGYETRHGTSPKGE